MSDEAAAARGADVVPDERSMLPLLGLIGAEFAALLGLLIWMS
jgi:hypothetical protein